MENSYIQIIKRLDKFASAFSGINRLEDLVNSIEIILEETFSADYTALYFYDFNENRLILHHAKGFNEEEKRNAEATAPERHPGLVFRSGQMIYVPDTLLDDKNLTQSSVRSFVVRSRLYLPVMNGKQIVGTFGIVAPTPNAYHDEDIAILSFICNMAGALYGNILNQEMLKLANEQVVNLSTLASESPNPIFRVSHEGILIYANSNYASRQVIDFHNLKTGKPIPAEFIPTIKQVQESGKAAELELAGNDSTYSFIITPVDGAGYINLYGRDITSRKTLENELNKMALIARETGNGVVITNKAGEIEWVNKAFTLITGYELAEVYGQVPGKILQGEETDPESVALLARAIKECEPIEVDIINYTKSKKKYWVKIQIQPVYNSAGKLDNFISIQKEITREKATEQELIKTTAFQRAILNSAAIAIISTDLNGLIQSFNPAACRMLGYEADEVIGIMTPHHYHDEKEIRNLSLGLDNSNKNEYSDLRIFEIADFVESNALSSETGEFTFIRKDGSKFPVSLTVTALRSEQNEITGFLALAEDITQRKEQFDALRVANLRFSSLISSMQASVLVEDEQRRLVLVNQHFCNLFAIPAPPEALIGGDCALAAESSKHLFIHPESFIRDIGDTIAQGKVVTNFELQMKDGTYLERDFIPIEDLGRKNSGILWIYRNITDRKLNEQNLLHQSEILSGTALATNYLLTLPDHNLAINKALEAIGQATGVDRVYIFENRQDELSGEAFFSQRFEWVADGIMPQLDNPALQNIPFSENFSRWYTLLSAGKPVMGLVKDFPENEREILEPQEIISLNVVPIQIQDRLWGIIGFDDCSTERQWTASESSTLTALAGSIGGSILRSLIENDLITARQLAEYATKTKSEFLAIMSHEIRTPMNGVIGMTSLLLKTSLSASQRDYAETIKVSGELLLNVINDILDFSKIESGKMSLEQQYFDLRKTIEDVLDLMAIAVSEKKLGLYFQVDSRIPQLIKGDLTRLRQILVNLCGNAIKFTNTGQIEIKVKQAESQGCDATLEFSVVDTGIGIPADKLDLLFKPFSQIDTSTTRKFGGTGLGLAICANLVKLMQGHIGVKSTMNKGSEFIFTIKTEYEEQSLTSKGSETIPGVLKGKKILVVDNNTVSVAILTSLLSDMEMETSMVSSAAQAFSMINSKRDIDIVLIDHDLPDMDGCLLASEIRKSQQNVNLPAIVSACPVFLANEPFANTPFTVRINKPLKHSQLHTTLVEMLSREDTPKTASMQQPRKMKEISSLYPMQILVAEDNIINQKLILNLLAMLGYSITIAANGTEALQTLGRMNIDIIFMDMQMPEMDGLEATRQIIAQYGEQRPLIVAMTANALSSDKDLCLAAGMDDYISKPLNIDQVVSGIEKWHSWIK